MRRLCMVRHLYTVRNCTVCVRAVCICTVCYFGVLVMYNKNNVFAKMISGEIVVEKIYDDEILIAINDINPAAPVHVLVIPKKSYVDFDDFSQNATEHEIVHYYKMIAKIAIDQGLSDYRLVTNKGSDSGQSVFHFHTHIIGGKKISELIDKGL